MENIGKHGQSGERIRGRQSHEEDPGPWIDFLGVVLLTDPMASRPLKAALRRAAQKKTANEKASL